MKKQVFNPYLPLDTYIPDGEPHVFGDRLYIYGSHEEEGGSEFCTLPYECWSAPVDDLTDWRCEGTIYRAEQDPDYGERLKYMYAPDVAQGPDGRYYLYYAMSGGCFTGPIHVAVCDTPAGKYEYYGAVRTPDGKELHKYITFDPGVINADGDIWLYYGWSLEKADVTANIPQEQLIPVEAMLFGATEEEIRACPHPYMGANAVRLAEDMLTTVGEPACIVPGQFDSFGTSFEGHAFFEASSMRKIGDTWYFIYSSQHQHELCYATSKYPDRDFVFGGVLVSNGDIGAPRRVIARDTESQERMLQDATEVEPQETPGMNRITYQMLESCCPWENMNFGNQEVSRMTGREATDRLAVTGNNHGSLVQIHGQWYIFYHRQTHKTTYSRQGCAERILLTEDGKFLQTEMTSCGLNGGPLAAHGTYPAPICCILTNGHMPHQTTKPIKDPMPHITNDGDERYISEIADGTRIGYRYFEFDGETTIALTLRTKACRKAEADGENCREANRDDCGKENVGDRRTSDSSREKKGVIHILADEKELAGIPVGVMEDWTACRTKINIRGTHALFLIYEGSGELEFLEFSFPSLMYKIRPYE